MNIRSRTGTAPYLAGLKRLKLWTRERFSLPDGATVLVTESPSSLPGFPPFETVAAFWTTPETRHEFTVFKRVEDVEEGDLPPAWMKPALVVEPGAGCNCC